MVRYWFQMLLAALALTAMPPGDLTYRWTYLQTNFYRPEAVQQALALVDRMSDAGYNGLVFTDTKLQSQAPYPDFYIKNVRTLLDHARAKHIEVIPVLLPTGYADGMLSHDPSLVESMPCRDVPFTVRKEELVPDDRANHFRNGDFESANGQSFAGFAFQDGAGAASFVDKVVRHGGNSSLRIESPGSLKETQGNCRVMQRVPVQPWRQYRFSGWIKTDNFDRAGDARAMALKPDGHALSFSELGLQPTQDWRRFDVIFNSQDCSEVLAYLGVWGGNKGKMWIDDVTLTDAGLLNVTRRPGCPLTIKGTDGVTYKEKLDVQPISDPKFGNIPWPGEFEFSHDAPTVKLAENSRLRSGDRVLISYYAVVATDQGKTAICPSEPKTKELMKAEVARALDLFGPRNVFFAHDEIRVMNWCDACQSRKLTPGELLASDIAAASNLAAGSQQFVWSDMFDPFHNAQKSYYLCNGSVEASWKGLSPKMVIVNWNSGRASESLKFFADRGHKQILAGYYDSDVRAIEPWIEKARATGSLVGVMYTTWADRYDDLEAFARQAWGK